MKRTLKNLIALESNVKIYVPGTKNINEITDNKKEIENTLTFLSVNFGGSTSYEALGCWQSQNGELIKERVIICESYCHETQLKKNIDSIIDYCETLKKDLNQEAISLEINNKLYFV